MAWIGRIFGGRDEFAAVKKTKSAAVLNIELTFPRAFGTTGAGSTQATGFIVDKRKGLILTNKHVVQDGPCRARAKTSTNEEFDVIPVYRDPVHDFGFFAFNPADIKNSPLQEIELDPNGATVGRNVLVIGNNAGEKLSFVPSTISRIDRIAPAYLDFNTFYITSSDTTVGGSSGGPMLTAQGKAVGMVAAGMTHVNISWYIPLQRIARTLELLKADQKVPRGTIQVSFKYNTFDAALKRNIISQEIIDEVKGSFPKAEGILVVEKNLPKGPARLAGIKNGDVLLKLNNNIVHNYEQLADVFDTFVSKEITLTILREKERMDISMTVQDLEELSNTRMVEISNGVFHGVPYSYAMNNNQEVEGVFCAKPGYMFSNVPGRAIIKRIGNTDCHSLDDFIAAVQSLSNGDVVSVKYQPPQDQTRVIANVVTVDKRWYPFELAVRNDKKGKWEYEAVENKPEDVAKDTKSDQPVVKIPLPPGESSNAELEPLLSALVSVAVTYPFQGGNEYEDMFGMLGLGGGSPSVCGIILDQELGIVLTDREIVGSSLCDVQLTFNKSFTIGAKVLYIHPWLPYTFLKFDPSLIDSDKMAYIAELKLSTNRPKVGEVLKVLALATDGQSVIGETKVTAIKDWPPMDGQTVLYGPEEYMEVSKALGDGVRLDKSDNSIKGYNSALGCNLVGMFEEIRDAVKNKKPIPSNVRAVPFTFKFILLSKARIYEMSDEWAEKMQSSMTLYDQKILTVQRRMVNHPIYDVLKENDMILTVDGKPVTMIQDYYKIIEGQDKIMMQVQRDSEVLDVEVSTHLFSTQGTTRLVHFGGLSMEEPRPVIAFRTKPEFLEDGGVYISHLESGSPAETALANDENITESSIPTGKLCFKIDEDKITTLDDVIQAILKKKDGDFVRVYAKDLEHGAESFHDIRLDLEYWKSRHMYLNESGDWVSEYIVPKES